MHIIYILILVYFFPSLPRVKSVMVPDGIDSESGEAEDFYNKTYTEHQTALERKIFRGYQVRRRPVRNESQPISVDVHWHIIHVSVNQLEQTMTMHGHLYMKWFDEFLVWDPKDFNDIRTVRCKKWQVWQPRIRVANSASGIHSTFEFASNAHVILQMQDKDRVKVEMYPTFSIKVGCAFDFSDFPNDLNRCAVNIFPTQPMTEIQLNVYYQLPPTLSLSWDEQYNRKRIISDFNLLNVTVNPLYFSYGNVSSLAPITENELAYTWSMLKTTVFFTRHSPMFFAGIAVPSVISAVLNALSFLIPSLPFACYCLMATMFTQMVFLQDMIKKLPLTVVRVPSSVKFYSFVMLATSISLLFHFIAILLTNSNSRVPPTLRHVYSLRAHFPTSWTNHPNADSEQKEEEHKWPRFLQFIRPLMGFTLCAVYFVQIVVFLVL